MDTQYKVNVDTLEHWNAGQTLSFNSKKYVWKARQKVSIWTRNCC